MVEEGREGGGLGVEELSRERWEKLIL